MMLQTEEEDGVLPPCMLADGISGMTYHIDRHHTAESPELFRKHNEIT